MKSKTPPPGERAQDERLRDDMPGRHVTSKDLARKRLLADIADAVGVPVATLYNSRSSSLLERGTDGSAYTDFDQECEALLQAYGRISDPERRRRLLTLVQEIAERA